MPMTVIKGSERDPDALSRAGWTLVAVVLLWPLLVLSGFDPLLLLDPQNLKAMGTFLSGFLPPESSPEFLGILFKATLETLAMATVGIAFALMLALPLAFVLTHSLSISRIGPASGRWRGSGRIACDGAIGWFGNSQAGRIHLFRRCCDRQGGFG